MLTKFLFYIVLCSQYANASIRISIDPGHGGEDHGAVYSQVREADLALAISKKLYTLLNADKEFQVQLIRDNDKTLTLEKRVEISEKFRSDLYISIHANANPNEKAKGAEFYTENQLPMDKESLRLAHNEFEESKEQSMEPMGDVESIVLDLKKTNRILTSYQLGAYLRKNWSETKSKMIRQGPFFVLNQNKVPSILIEVGYLTNSSERNRMVQNHEQNLMAKKIYSALKDFVKNMDKLPSSILQPQNAKTR
jgi:N-acetylmuramoyl-L-alanine amidase